MENIKFNDAARHQIVEVWGLSGEGLLSVMEALSFLYISIATRSEVAEDFDLDSELGELQYAGVLYQVQKTIAWTPLRFMLRTLVDDPSLVIRIAAKSELVDHEGLRWTDGEAEQMERANLAVKGASNALQDLLDRELRESQLIKTAFELWQGSGVKEQFSPGPNANFFSPGSAH